MELSGQWGQSETKQVTEQNYMLQFLKKLKVYTKLVLRQNIKRLSPNFASNIMGILSELIKFCFPWIHPWFSDDFRENKS